MSENANKKPAEPNRIEDGDLFEDVALFEWHDETKGWKFNPEVQ